jgi:midasin
MLNVVSCFPEILRSGRLPIGHGGLAGPAKKFRELRGRCSNATNTTFGLFYASKLWEGAPVALYDRYDPEMERNNNRKASKMANIEQLATAALEPGSTDDLFVQYDGLFTELGARWIQKEDGTESKVAAFGRLLPLAPHLAEHVERFLQHVSNSSVIGSRASTVSDGSQTHAAESELLEVLLGTFRLLSYDCRSFAKYVRPLALQNLFQHSSRTARYVAIRTFCLYVHAADYATQEMLKRYVGQGEVAGPWEAQQIDYRFLSLWEEKRWKNLQSRMQQRRSEGQAPDVSPFSRELSPYTVDVNGTLLPRLDGAPSQEMPSALIATPTTESNLKDIAQGLLGSGPLLLTGLAGSGKTLLVRHFAWQLNKLDQMVTLHLNEQSDAKLLIGMYATGAKPGTFSWRAGVLTTAVREGRWIFIEDLDRAPNEVISTLLPLIERGELLIPSRGETVRAARGFRIIATMRSTLNPRGQEIVPRQNMIGHRFWNLINVRMPALSEFRNIINATYPRLREHLPGIMKVYARLLELYSDPKFSSENGTSLRAMTPRDLLKWCDRIDVLLAPSRTFSTAQKDEIFMEGFDCFAGSLRGEAAQHKVMACVAEELHIDPQRMIHLLKDREVKLQVPPKTTSSGNIQIGRARLSKHKVTKRTSSNRPFSTNNYTLRLLEKIAVAVDRQEPLLLVGETGTGKTTCIQYLAEQLGRKLVAFNLSQQSESGDLLGGYKPVNVRSLVIPLKDEFDDIFDTTFSRKKNQRFIEMLGKRVAKGEWKRVCGLWREALKMVDAARKSHESQTSSPDPEGEQPKKKRKTDSLPMNFPTARWEKFATDLYDLEAQLASGSEAFAFSFLEGNIVKAVRNGDWILLDEINLASSDTLEALTDLLGGGPDGRPSILLTETGNVERVVAHPNFRVFAAMNPATDVGKKDLPPGVRSRFTELYVESPDGDEKSLRNIVEKYLGGDIPDQSIVRVAQDVTTLYLKIQEMAKSNRLVDGADQKAHFSLRTLTRTLTYAREIAPLRTLRRALYEGFQMSFLTFLGRASEDLVAPLITAHLFPQKGMLKTELGQPLKQPSDGRSYISHGHYWLRQGVFPVEEQPHYIITPFVQRNMNNLIRAASTRRYPVLIQGPTSSGKTSMIEYLAKKSGNKFVRINNHEHTDLQEYLGSYISGADGKLVFQEGILVKALREGHWIVLDELNLAPTDVLEALNRLLDDNRELLIPETQEVVRPHDDFMLFATQNPAGLYGGRKVLSRAFRNRFLELHFDDIPVEELTEILHRRTMIPESWCKRIVKVYQELSTLRQENRIFEQKSFATLRDLFRWAQRKADTIQDLANNGYMLLAERVRKEEERVAVKNVMETVMSKNGPKVTIDVEKMFTEDAWSGIARLSKEKAGASACVVWTGAMRRLFVLVAHALRNNEPVLLIGETGCGKTTVCQLLADEYKNQLHILNAHQNTETGDLIGAQRPIRNRAAIEESIRTQVLDVFEITKRLDFDPTAMNLEHLLDIYDKLVKESPNIIPTGHRQEIHANRIKAAALFEWADGSLVHAMKQGHYFLLDEISLADDSVLERLNSVLEPSRTLLLAEKGPNDSEIIASDGFQFLATMNPGGDYGKKELSPALRNRFTEIWVPAMSDLEDIMQIVQSKLNPAATQYAGAIVSFSQWFNDKYNTSVASSISIRDTLAWVSFLNSCPQDDPIFGVVHGAAMVFIDTLGANPAGLLAISQSSIQDERRACLHQLSKLLGQDIAPLYFNAVAISSSDQFLQLGSFSIPKFSATGTATADFAMEAPTTCSNAMRVVRALQLPKPILLEGNPGVGKTTLVTALAKAIGKPLTRLNLSEQTDLMDLFGSDVPVEGGAAGTFAWRDAPFLKAMKNGDWVLLDEMNLASQSVLEGLNAVLDHRGEVYISELDQTFHKHQNFRVFAAQNPHHQGGGRKGLPASFVNRFTVVYADVFQPEDLTLICKKRFPAITEYEVNKLIDFVAKLDDQVVGRRAFGQLGAPWEFNLRDTLRWLHLLADESMVGSARDFLDAIFLQRFRSESDRNRLLKLFEDVYGTDEPRMTLYHNISTQTVQVGLGVLSRVTTTTRPESVSIPRISQLGPIEALLVSVKQNWPVIVVGPPGAGKTAIINQLASFAGADLVNFSMNADVDAMDLVGGYEQVDPLREVHRCMERLEEYLRTSIASAQHPSQAQIAFLEQLQNGAMVSNSHTDTLLQSVAQSSKEAFDLITSLIALLQSANQHIDGARFQWVDGILIRALEQGKWLVLDNANLCSSAVLDRLNSLLEPNGYLSINEHSMADGEARIVRPHPNFRIFMTMDPRFGELSRAMRNRAVEIYLLDPHDTEIQQAQGVIQYPLDSTMYRFRGFQTSDAQLDATLDARFENLSFEDSELLDSFTKQSKQSLIPDNSHTQTNGISGEALIARKTSSLYTDEKLARMAHFLSKAWVPQAKSTQQAAFSDLSFPSQFLTYHPLSNELKLHRDESSSSQGLWLASMYDFMLDVYNMQLALTSLPSARLERRKEKQKLPAFLHSYYEVLSKVIGGMWNARRNGEHTDDSCLKALRTLFWAFLAMVQGSGFDRATFQTYLKMLSSSIPALSEQTVPLLQDLNMGLSKQIAVFGSDVQLTTGLAMERIWRAFKPITPKSHAQLTAVLKLEQLADRLDAVMWKSQLTLDEMAQIRERIASSLDLVRKDEVDAAELIGGLSAVVDELEQSTTEYDAISTPYFETEFEGLCQFLDVAFNDDQVTRQLYQTPLPAVISTRAKSALLARRPTKLATITVGKPYKPTEHFAKLYRHLGLTRQPADALALQGRFHVSMLAKLHGADEVQLAQLDRFEAELQIIGQHIALEADRITNDQAQVTEHFYRSIYNALYASHCADICHSLDNGKIVFHDNAPVSSLYRSTLESGFKKCARADSDSVDAKAWIHLGLFGLVLSVPNYPHDPALRPMIERKMFNEGKQGLHQALAALRQFQHEFTGQDTSFRIRQVETAVQQLGEEPPVPAIVRPETSQLDDLQGEFMNLLSILRPLLDESISISDAVQDTTLQQNLSHIIQRLTEGYRAYDDITDIIVGFLVCLNLGLVNGRKEQEAQEQSNVHKSLTYISRDTAFFGRQRSIGSSEDIIEELEQGLNQGEQAIDVRYHALHTLLIVKSTDPKALSKPAARSLLHNLFTSFYEDWQRKLRQDQEKQAIESSLYTYRGMDEDDDEEDPTLFPDYEAEQHAPETATAALMVSRDHEIRLANMHADLFGEGRDASDTMKALLTWSASELRRVSDGKARGTRYADALPAIYLALEKKADALASSGTGKTYNFYFDANLPEAQRLMSLLHRIQTRYRQIRNVWPEHATLSEVLRTCDEVLEFRHVDPVAKLITKAEKLYAYMHEWQSVASKEYSTANLYDDLTRLLVSWRQLELTTWARLFDLEVEKLRNNAKTWFFVAYETVIAASEGTQDEESMRTHAKNLLDSLKGFFETTTLGQFEQRLKLLQQLRAHAAMRMQDVEAFEILHTALTNFINYYSRLSGPVKEAIAKGRANLEEEVSNVIKLASWKDTNIDALKQSAKISHKKLSKWVRKFRALLNKPVSSIMGTALPDETHTLQEAQLTTILTAVAPETLEFCAKNIFNWNDRPARFRNLSVTTKMMRNLASPDVDAVDGGTYVDNLVIELLASITELQKATPSTLTEENKETVQHLKTQKRKVYADTMKELRQMGVNSNLSVDTLVKQYDLSTVLSTIPLVQSGENAVGSVAEYHLHKALNIMPQVRGVSKEHSGDLTPNDVAKSIGYLEGLLHITIRQRNGLSKAARHLEDNKTPMALVEHLSALSHEVISWVPEEHVEATARIPASLRWLAAVLRTGADIVSAQAKLGKTGQLSDLMQAMRQCSTKLNDLASQYDQLPQLPANIQSEAHRALEDATKAHVDEIHVLFRDWIDSNDMSRTILVQIQAFLFSCPEVKTISFSEDTRNTLETQSQEILAALDSILGSMQDVENALKQVPSSTDDASWLVKEEQALLAALNALHAPQISESIQILLDKVQYLGEDPNLQAIAALFASVKPILSQYVACHEYLVKRFDNLHAATANLLHRLSKSFIQIGTSGFCQPPEKGPDQQKGQNEKLEEGTGLGAGEGAEDISKDIEDDEDLEDLAQEKGEREGSIEENEDAVDMGDGEMEGETEEVGEKEDKGDESGEEGEDDVQSEVGSVDDLGPSAVDEKMWDEGGKEDDAKDKEGKEDVGTENQDEQVAAEQKEKEKEKEKDGEDGEENENKEGEEDEEMDMEGEDQEENVGVGETEKMDPHAKEEETLDLPEDLDIDGQDDNGKEDDDLGDMDMGDDLPEDEMDEPDAGAQPDTVDDEIGPEEEGEEEKETTGHIEDEEQPPEDQEDEGDEPMDDDAVPLPDDNVPEDEARDTKDNDQADPNADAGAGNEANEEAHKNKNEQASASAANQDEGQEGDPSEQNQEETAEDGTLGQTTRPDAGGRGEQPEESREKQSFKKLGDMLEKWYDQQKQISEAREKDETQAQQLDKEVDMADADFEHLQDEKTQADTQALGTATEEQATALDHDMALPVNDEEEKMPTRPEDNDQDEADAGQDVDMQDAEVDQDKAQEDQQQSNSNEGQPQTFVGEQKPYEHDEDQDMEDTQALDEDTSDTSSVHDVETQLELTHLDTTNITPDTARALWLAHESATHSLSQQLTEHLRLILAPTLATKLRGDFRTGKRLNLKRIIPYIASGYKRDKIWLRRSQPSKRSYQVMIALDDSKSMAESGASSLALKTLTLVTKSLAMLEVGEVSVVGFGDQVNVAHDFDKPFTSEAGVRVFEQFGFDAAKTNVRGLVDRSLELFRDARNTQSSSLGEDLWQLMLIVSDGICDSHAEIQRLVRKAQEDRVMIVFIIIDSTATEPRVAPVPKPSDEAGAQPPAPAMKEKDKTSILDLQSVEISKEGKVVRWKYMERFPFRYYLVVRDVRELPGVLAGALRQWFGEVAGTA